MGQFDAARSEQMDILQEKNLDVQGKELEEANQRYTSVHYPQSLGEYVDSDSEEPEMDPEEEPEEDPEEEPEEDPEDEPEEDPEEELEKEPEEDPEEEPGEDLEMDGNLCHEKVDVESAAPLNLSSEIFSAKQLTEHENEEPSAECVFKPNPETETNRSYQNSSDVKQRRVVNAAVRPSISQSYGLEMNCKYDEASEQEFNIEYAAIDSGQLEEAVVGNENSVEQANPGKRRCSKWDQGPKEDKKEVIEERKCKKGKTVWDANDSKSAVQEPVQLTDVRNRVCGPLLDLEVQSLIKRFSEISSLLDPLVDDKLEIGAYTFDKLIKEREKIFLELAKRNAIISKELYVPVKEYPTYNFIGLILGPKGNTQKRMELKSGCRIRLRGKDSSKSAQEADPSEDEELNVYIEAVSQKSLDAAVCMVKKLLISVEDEMNDQKRAHLAELFNLKAATLFSSCSVCKERGHNQLACPQKKATVMATSDTCKSFSHPSSGCPVTPSNLKFKSSGEIDAANLYIGFLPQTMDDSRLRDLFSPFGTITHLRVTLDMKTGYCKGHGFVRFDTPSAASLAIMHMNGYRIDGHRLRVKIAGAPPATGQPATSLLPVCSNSGPATVAASYSASPHEMMPKSEVSVLNDEGIGVTSSLNKESSYKIYQTEVPTIPQKALGCNLYVGYLPQTIDDSHLRDLFSPFGTINQVRVALDMGTGYSKGYGFVRFDTPSAASLAIMHMNGYEIDGHRLTVKIAGDPPATGQQATSLLPVNPNPGPETVASSYSASPHYMMPKGKMSVLNAEGIGVPSSLNMESSYEISQTEAPTIPQKVSGSNLFVGYLPLTVDESGLWELFSPFGTIIQLRVPLDRGTGYSKGYGFVRFDTPSAASLALMHLNGYEIDGHRLKVNIAGDPPATRQAAASLLPVNPLPGPATVATSCPALPDGMMFNSERLCYPSSQDIKYSTSLYVGYLPQTIDDSCLRELFSPFGTVTQSSVMLDMRTGYSKGYGFVTFDTPSAASIAMIHMNGYEIDGHRLAVSMRTVGAAPPTGPPATSGFPLYSIPQHTAVATSCPALPSYMMPNFSQNMESKNEKEAPIVSHEVPGSTGSNSPLPSTAFVLRSTESGTASSSAGSRTALSSIGLAAASSESRSVISSYSFSSLFRGDHDNLGSKS